MSVRKILLTGGPRAPWGARGYCSQEEPPVGTHPGRKRTIFQKEVEQPVVEAHPDVGDVSTPGRGGGKVKKKTIWTEIETRAQVADDDDDEEEISPDQVPHTFSEYLKHCNIVGAVSIPDLFMKDGLPERVSSIITSLKDISCLHLLNDEAFYYLLMCGWLPEMHRHRYRVFDADHRKSEWKSMMKILNSMSDQWGPKTLAALMHLSSSLGLTEETLELYRTAEERGVLTRYSLPSVMYSLGYARDIDRAGEVFRWIEEKGIRGEDYRSFIFANSKVGNWRDARYYYEQYKKATGGESLSAQDEKVMTTLLAAYSRGRNWKGAEEMFEEITAKYPPTNIHTSCLIASNATGSINGYNRARMCFLRSYDITYTSSANAWMKVMAKTYSSLLSVSTEHVDGIEKSLSTSNWNNNETFCRLANMKITYLAQRFWKLYGVMKSFPTHYKPDAITYFHAMKFAKLSKNPDMALAILRDASLDGIKHVALYNLAIGAFARCVDISGTFALFKELRAEKLVPNANTYAALTEGLGPGQGTNNAITVMETVQKSGIEPTGMLLAGCARAFGSAATVSHLANVCRAAVEQSTNTESGEAYPLDSAWFWHCLERPLLQREVAGAFFNEYPDFNERCFEVAGGPLQHLRAPRAVHTSLEDMKQWFVVAPGKSVWVLTDEWMLPLGDKLRDIIAHTLEAKDRVVIPYYCLLRLGNIVRTGHANIKLKEAAFVVLTTLQELFDESAKESARGEVPTVDTVYFSEQLHADPMYHTMLDKQDEPQWDKDRKEELSGFPIPYDVELFSTQPLQDQPTLKYMSRRSVAYARLIQQFQVSTKSLVYLCARNPEHLALAKKMGLETASVEDVLGPDWLKKAKEEDEKLMLSWKAPEDVLGIEATQHIPALTETSFSENEYLQSQHSFSLEEGGKAKEAPKVVVQQPKMAAYAPAAEFAKEAKSNEDAEVAQKEEKQEAKTTEEIPVKEAEEPVARAEQPAEAEPTAEETSEVNKKEVEQVAPVTWKTWGTMVQSSKADADVQTASEDSPAVDAAHMQEATAAKVTPTPTPEVPAADFANYKAEPEVDAAPVEKEKKPKKAWKGWGKDKAAEAKASPEVEVDPKPSEGSATEDAKVEEVAEARADKVSADASRVAPVTWKTWGTMTQALKVVESEAPVQEATATEVAPTPTPEVPADFANYKAEPEVDAAPVEKETVAEVEVVKVSGTTEADETKEVTASEEVEISEKEVKQEQMGEVQELDLGGEKCDEEKEEARKRLLEEAAKQGFANYATEEDGDAPKKKKKKKEWGGWGSKKKKGE